ncbi:cryptochrome/photolyase family protein [Sphingomonas donggukensis]|uniref:Cryptochrome/photolyase family protein n=1 Tax=Sphingomonas donggukensis TaxID=2949093 RepID=A0ABY4TUR8_9SPHN|nr:cryptochrome/photolyase family protein [Sphingomonas donggukensis]URW75207.1 cryptochrome/photolyase family protein [Sphingomonas donggukensis]
MTVLIPILGDQLSHGLASLREVDQADAVVLMMEVADETTYVRHHPKKIALILSAMRHFAVELKRDGWRVDYVALDARGNTGSFTGEVARAVKRHAASAIRIVEAGEWRVQQMILGWEQTLGVPVEVLADDRFFCSTDDFRRWAKGRKSLVMEYFYREMRQQTGLLMTADGTPVGGKWNYDHDNRKTPPRGLNYPAPSRFTPDEMTRDVLALVAKRFGTHFGDLEPFAFPVTAAQARHALKHFITTALPGFGDYQDAMLSSQDTLYHSVLSPALNCGLLTPREVCDAAVAAYDAEDAPINAVEGFVRQILGWREYIRGMYWLEMPGFADANALRAMRPLPEFYWTAETDMRCLHIAVKDTRTHAYAHHIQRLMVLGNFAMLAGVDPKAIDDWFLIVYADAYQWVELPNVLGMSQHADGGRLASKPYAGGGAYINRMSDYCGRCRYDVKAKTGPDACPFNYLYWDFLARHARRFEHHPRMANMYRTWARMDDAHKRDVRASAKAFLESLKPAAEGWAR